MGNISLHKDKDQIVITITAVHTDHKPIAVILNYSGEVIEKHELKAGLNKINVSVYKDRNCAVRIMNDKNVVVQKI